MNMIKQDILKAINIALQEHKIPFSLDDKSMDIIALDVTRVADEEYTEIINDIKYAHNIKINSVQKNILRKQLLGYPVKSIYNFDIPTPHFRSMLYDNAYKLLAEGFKKNKSVMISSIIARIKSNFLAETSDTTKQYLKYIQKQQQGKKQLLVIKVNADNNYTADNIMEIIKAKYDSLSNYHHAVIIFADGNKTISWSLIAQVALSMEQFKSESNFNLYEKRHKSKRLKEFLDFITNNKYINYSNDIIKQAKKFYSAIAYGFQFEDLFITIDGKNKVLIMQKVELDEAPKRCPSCLQTMVRGNSYLRLLFKSFECTNPNCPARSKTGRGKRFTLYSAKQYTMLARNSKLDYIDNTMYQELRHDIVNNITIEQIIRLYSWSGDIVELINVPVNYQEYKGRKIVNTTYNKFKLKQSELPIISLFKAIINNITFVNATLALDSKEIANSRLFMGNSTDIIPSEHLKVDGAVSSPPYYNAREYSQWNNLLFYLIDMLINAKAVYNSLANEGTYIYNIGDVIGQDNIYVNTTISKRRQMLGFYSIILFELLGYKIKAAIIWDKGEVQSKRNVTPNHISGYVKPVNSYEYCLVFCKNSNCIIQPTKVLAINTVKKINAKGVNTFGHTAPYPEEIPRLIRRYVPKRKTILDPYLGSGTTIIALQNDYHVIGIEKDEQYYQLALKRVKHSNQV